MIWDAIPFWLQSLIEGLGLFTLMAFSTVIVTRMGRNPYWALFAVLPFVLVPGIWLLALTRWPSVTAAALPAQPSSQES